VSLAGALLAGIARWRGDVRLAFATFVLLPCLVLLAGRDGLQHYAETKSTQPFVEKIPALPPRAEIACLECFPTGLPFYLKRCVTVVSTDGKELTSQQLNPVLSPKLLKTAFGLSQGADSDVEQDADKGEIYAVHVDKVIAPNPPNLDEPGIRPVLTNYYMQQAVVSALEKRGADAQAAIQKGQSFEAAAAAAGGQVGHQLGMQRIAAQQYQQAIGQSLLGQIFQAKPGVVFTAGSDQLRGYVVARVDAIHPGDPRQVAQVLEMVRQRANEGYLESLAGAVRELAVNWVKPRTDIGLARDAMGIDPAMVTRLSPKLLSNKAAGPAQ